MNDQEKLEKRRKEMLDKLSDKVGKRLKMKNIYPEVYCVPMEVILEKGQTRREDKYFYNIKLKGFSGGLQKIPISKLDIFI